MHVNDVTIEELKKLPRRKWDEDIGIFDSLVIIPENEIHESGYRCMDFAAVKDGEAFCLLSGRSDVVHIDGIGGYGNWRDNIPKLVVPTGWSIDCLAKSGLLRLFSRSEMTCGAALSSFEIFCVKEST